MIVIYTADVETAPEEFSAGCLTLKMERAFLRKIDSEGEREELARRLKEKLPLSDDELMKLIILPLTYKGTERKKQAVKEAVELAKQIADSEKKTFVLSGILIFADKIIDADTAKYIKEVVRMTQVAELLLEEGREEGRKEGRKEGREESRIQGINALIDSLKSLLIPDETIVNQLMERYQLTKGEADAFIRQR